MNSNDLIRGALLDLGVIQSGEQPEPAAVQDCLVVLNGMMDSWQTEQLMIFTQTPHKFTLQAGKQAYTLGVDGDFNMARPVRIERITMIDNVLNPIQPLELPLDMITDAQWAAIPVKSVQNQYPGRVWDDGGYPLRTLSYWPVPTVNIETAIYAWEPLMTFASANTSLLLPPGYQEALRYNLAVRMAPQFDVPVPPAVQQQAVESMDRVKTMNTEIELLRCDPAVATADNRLFAWIDFISGR